MKILITGTSSGIGRFLADHLASEKHQVWGVARSAQSDFETSARARNLVFISSQCDVADWSQVSSLAAQVERQWGSLDALICCSGIQSPIGPAMTVDPLEWSRNIRVNLDGTFYPIRALYHLLLRGTPRAKVICFSGGGSTSPRPHFSAYAAAKSAVVRLVENLAHEWAQQPVDINAVAPGAIYTKMTEETIAMGPEAAGEKEFASALELKQKGDAPLQKVAGLLDFLLSARSNGISGRLISAPWDPWAHLDQHANELRTSDIFTLRRIRPEDRGLKWE
jgi:NAD(P)-dependent dehydrogenase (short-subunit alcohol dehydrogenase family)